MAGVRELIQKLAKSQKVGDGVHKIAAEVAKEASRIDPAADMVVSDVTLVVNGMERVATIVENQAPDAAAKEFGGAKQQGWRPVGRAVARVGRVSRVS